MLTITNQSDYGILFIERLLDEKDYISLSELVKKTHLPKRFLARIGALLAKRGIVESREGKLGGYRLTKKIKTLSLLEYLRIFEKDLNIVKCARKKYQCRFKDLCRHNRVLRFTLNKLIINQLRKITLKNIL